MNPLFASVATRLPAQDLDRAKRWYEDKLGLSPVEARPGGLRYLIGDGEFCLFESASRSPGTFTQLGITVFDIRHTMEALRRSGVVFREYDHPSISTRNGVAEVDGNYPSKGQAELGCWFNDSEGNLLSLGQSLR